MSEPRERLCECFPLDFRALPEVAARSTSPNQDLLNRLQRTFWNTFMKLPEPARTAINVHWNRERPGAGVPTPTLELSSHPAGSARKDVLAATNSVRFWFHPHVVETAPDDILETLVAHELAHAYFQSKGKHFRSAEAEEGLIPTLTFGWGYEDEDIDLWMAEVTASPDLSAV